MTSISLLGFLCLLILGCTYAEQETGKDYRFSYTAGDSARSETADEDGQVEGSYTYVADDGNQKTVKYVAGKSGFIAEGDGILNVPQLIEDTRARLAASGRSYEPSSEEVAAWRNADRSYSMSYHAGDSARSEVSSADGFVTGRYSYVDKDGVERIVEYEAGPGIGFRVKGEHINAGISDASVRSSFEHTPLQLTEYTLRSGLKDQEAANIQSGYGADGSYKYSYQSSDQGRTETVGPYGDVEGSYTYIGEDGRQHTANYVAGSGTGFVVSGDHLASSAGIASDLSAARQRLASTSVGGAVATGGQRQTVTTIVEGNRLGETGSRFDASGSRFTAGGSRLGVATLGGGRSETVRKVIKTKQAGRVKDVAGVAQSSIGQAGERTDISHTQTIRRFPGTAQLVTIPGSTQTQRYTTYSVSKEGTHQPSVSLINRGAAGLSGSNLKVLSSSSQAGSLNRLLGLHGAATGGKIGLLTTIPDSAREVKITKEIKRFTGPSGAAVNLLHVPLDTRRQQTSRTVFSGTKLLDSSDEQKRVISSNIIGPRFIKFSTSDGGQHGFNIH